MSNSQKYPNNLKLIRFWRGLSQIELADAAKTSQSAISKYESGALRISIKLRKVFADTLGVSERMIEEPVIVIPQRWERLVSDPRMAFIVDYVLSCSDEQIAQQTRNISLQVAHSHAP